MRANRTHQILRIWYFFMQFIGLDIDATRTFLLKDLPFLHVIIISSITIRNRNRRRKSSRNDVFTALFCILSVLLATAVAMSVVMVTMFVAFRGLLRLVIGGRSSVLAMRGIGIAGHCLVLEMLQRPRLGLGFC
jgi:hypothetical protein